VPLAYDRVIQNLKKHGVEFVIIGANAAIAQGAPIGTLDFDFCYRHTKDNCQRVVEALRPFRPRLRGAPEDLPFKFDAETLVRGCNFTFTTEAGDVDILGHVTGMGGYEDIAKSAVEIEFMGLPVLVMSLEDVIKSKRAAGRPKDLMQLKALEETLRVRWKQQSAANRK
jgi:hypothetical protein